MTTKAWNVNYLLGNTSRQMGDAGNPHTRKTALDLAKVIAKNGWCVWVEHERSGLRIYESEQETARQGTNRTAEPVQEYPVDGYYSTGIKLIYSPHAGWCATVEFATWLFAAADSIEGSVGTKYHEADLTKVIDLVCAAAQKVGVVFVRNAAIQPHIYVERDGEDPAVHLPVDWREVVKAQCDRLGWETCYEPKDQVNQRISAADR